MLPSEQFGCMILTLFLVFTVLHKNEGASKSQVG